MFIPDYLKKIKLLSFYIWKCFPFNYAQDFNSKPFSPERFKDINTFFPEFFCREEIYRMFCLNHSHGTCVVLVVVKDLFNY